jgi:hypothetical protein
MKAAFERSKTTSGQMVDYGFGWFKEANDPGRFSMEGGTMGFRSTYFRAADKRFSVIILTNRNVFDDVYDRKIKPLMKIFL